jgi:sulfur carrier protein ThiS
MRSENIISAAFTVEKLQQFVGLKLDLFVIEVGGSVVAGDEAGAMQAAEVAEPGRVEVLRLRSLRFSGQGATHRTHPRCATSDTNFGLLRSAARLAICCVSRNAGHQ